NKTSASFPSSTIQCGGVRMPAGVQRMYGFCPPLAPFSGVALSTGGLLFLAAVLVAFPPNTRAQDPPQSSDQKVEKEFYTPKDRIEALRGALRFTPRAVGEADALEGPPQEPKRLHVLPND